MNCKQGDLAIIVRSKKWGLEGKIVQCLAVYYGKTTSGTSPTETTAWLVDQPINRNGRVNYLVNDMYLRPLRDSDGTDETLSWIDVPNEVTA